ncbi:MAG: hypothetical protein RLZZ361_309 [Cyanobacteriota bacterium]
MVGTSAIKSAIQGTELTAFLSDTLGVHKANKSQYTEKDNNLFYYPFSMLAERQKPFSDDRSNYVAHNPNNSWENILAQRTAINGAQETQAIQIPQKTKSVEDNGQVDKELAKLQALFGAGLNQAFVNDFIASGFSAGSTDTEKSFDPLKEIAQLKDGTIVTALNAFFKIKDITDSSVKAFAQGLYANGQWGAYSRAFDDLFIHALTKNNPKKEGLNSQISNYIALTAKLGNDAINNSGKKIADPNRALVVSYLISHTAISDKLAEELGFSKDQIAKYNEGDKAFLISEALFENPNILTDKDKTDKLTSFLSTVIQENYDKHLAHFKDTYAGEGNNLGAIEGNSLKLLQGKYADDVKKLNGGSMPSAGDISSYLAKWGYGPSQYTKVDNSEQVAQTYLNLKAIEHDHELFKKGLLTDENRMYKASQTVIRSTPNAGADGNAAFNENNLGRKMSSLAGMDRNMVGVFALPFTNDQHLMDFVSKLKDLNVEISALDISHHGSPSGTHGGNGGFDCGDKNTLLKAFIERMKKGGEITYNSCSIGAGTDKNSGNLQLATITTPVEDKGIKVHAADACTIGYQEHFVYDAFSRLVSNTPVKLDGVVGGFTVQEAGVGKIINEENVNPLAATKILRSNDV